MTRLLLIILSATLSCAFVLPETPAQRRAREEQEHAWAKTVIERYDLPALLGFLRQTVKEKKTWREVDLTKPNIGAEWKIGGVGMASGDWQFTAPDLGKGDFTMSFIYEAGARRYWLILKCVRVGRKNFRLIDISNEEVVILIL